MPAARAVKWVTMRTRTFPSISVACAVRRRARARARFRLRSAAPSRVLRAWPAGRSTPARLCHRELPRRLRGAPARCSCDLPRAIDVDSVRPNCDGMESAERIPAVAGGRRGSARETLPKRALAGRAEAHDAGPRLALRPAQRIEPLQQRGADRAR